MEEGKMTTRIKAPEAFTGIRGDFHLNEGLASLGLKDKLRTVDVFLIPYVDGEGVAISGWEDEKGARIRMKLWRSRRYLKGRIWHQLLHVADLLDNTFEYRRPTP